MKRSQRLRWQAAAVMTAAALGVAACSSSSSSSAELEHAARSAALTASAPGITATTITIGSHQPLTGPAAPGYSEIAPASAAYFDYVNANGGVYGRKIVYKYLNDAYDPTTTASVVRQLVLQDNVYAIFNGLGTPTHLAVVSFLNSREGPRRVRRVRLRLLEPAERRTRRRSAGSSTTSARARSSGSTSRSTSRARRSATSTRTTSSAWTGSRASTTRSRPRWWSASRATSPPTSTSRPQVAALRAAGAQVVVSFSIPAFTALLKLNSLKLGFSPTLVVSNVGSDPITLSGLLESFAKQGGATVNGNQLTNGIITDGYLPALGDTSNSWIALFKKIHDQYDAKAPFDGNCFYGMAVAYTFVQAMLKAGRNPTRADLVSAINARAAAGSRGRPVRLLLDRPRGCHRRLHRRHQQRVVIAAGTGPGHGHDRDRRDHHLHRNRASRRRPAASPHPDASRPSR